MVSAGSPRIVELPFGISLKPFFTSAISSDQFHWCGNQCKFTIKGSFQVAPPWNHLYIAMCSIYSDMVTFISAMNFRLGLWFLSKLSLKPQRAVFEVSGDCVFLFHCGIGNRQSAIRSGNSGLEFFLSLFFISGQSKWVNRFWFILI